MIRQSFVILHNWSDKAMWSYTIDQTNPCDHTQLIRSKLCDLTQLIRQSDVIFHNWSDTALWSYIIDRTNRCDHTQLIRQSFVILHNWLDKAMWSYTIDQTKLFDLTQLIRISTVNQAYAFYESLKITMTVPWRADNNINLRHLVFRKVE